MTVGVSTFHAWKEKIEKLSDLAEILSESRHDILEGGLLPYELRYTVHPTVDMKIGSVRKTLRLVTISILGEVIKAAVRINAELLIVHPGHVGWKHDAPASMKSLVESIKDLENLSDEYGITNFDYPLFTKLADVTMLENLEFVLDVGHANTAGKLPDLPIGEENIDFGTIARRIGNCEYVPEIVGKR